MRILTAEEARQIDQESHNEISAAQLVENAGRLSAEWISKHGTNERDPRKINTLILSGPGNNGADGLVVARHLASQGWPVTVIFVETQNSVWNKNKNLLPASVKCLALDEFLKSASPFAAFGLIIDSLFGIGLNRPLAGIYKNLIDRLNQDVIQGEGPKNLISLDTPSGLESTRGLVLGSAVRATHTLTFGFAKTGFFINKGPSHAGRIHVLDVGFSPAAIDRLSHKKFVLSKAWVLKNKPVLADDGNKSNRGRSLLITGSRQFPGAGFLSARAALRSGSGYALLAHDGASPSAAEHPDLIFIDLKKNSLHDLKYDAVGIGSGLGVNARTKKWLCFLRDHHVRNVVVDADAITVCAEENLFPLPKSWVLTPHAGELGRVLGRTAAVIEKDRFHYAQLASQKLGCVVFLKGFHSILAFDETAIVVATGNAALAKSGTGDVLTGMITAFMAQGLDSRKATLMASYIHGKVADDWVQQKKDPASFLASDLIEALPLTMGKLQRSASIPR